MEFLYNCAATATAVVADVVAALAGTADIQASSPSAFTSEEVPERPAEEGSVRG